MAANGAAQTVIVGVPLTTLAARRGAYVCDARCASVAARRGAFARAFRRAVTVQNDLVESGNP